MLFPVVEALNSIPFEPEVSIEEEEAKSDPAMVSVPPSVIIVEVPLFESFKLPSGLPPWFPCKVTVPPGLKWVERPESVLDEKR